MEIHGPEGTTAMTEGMKAMFGHDVRCRGGATPKVNLTHVDVREFAEGLVLDRDGLRVSAFQVEHCDGNPAFGFRVECEGASVVISGDTIYTENLVRHAQGASVVIHNVIAASEAYLASFPAKSRVLKKLASPEECAKAFMRIAPRLAVFTHVINLGTTVEALCERTRRAGYAGPLHVASDRTVIDLGREIVVHGPQPLDDLPDLTCPEDSSLLDCSGALGNAPALFTRLLA
jgi:ribonuclease Z